MAGQLFPARGCEAVILCTFAFVGQLPRCGNPAFGLQPMEGRIEGAGLHLQKFLRSPLNVLRNGVAVRGSGLQRSKDEKV